MANTFTQIHIHTVFAVKHRKALIDRSWRDELFMYMSGIIQHHQHKLLAIGGMPDHVHIFFGMRPTQSLSELMQQVKGCSSAWINERRLVILLLHGNRALALFLMRSRRCRLLSIIF